MLFERTQQRSFYAVERPGYRRKSGAPYILLSWGVQAGDKVVAVYTLHETLLYDVRDRDTYDCVGTRAHIVTKQPFILHVSGEWDEPPTAEESLLLWLMHRNSEEYVRIVRFANEIVSLYLDWDGKGWNRMQPDKYFEPMQPNKLRFVREVAIRPSLELDGLFEAAPAKGEVVHECDVLNVDILNVDAQTAIYELGVDELPDGVEDIRGKIKDEPPRVFAIVTESSEPGVSTFWYFGLEPADDPDESSEALIGTESDIPTPIEWGSWGVPIDLDSLGEVENL